MKQETTLCLHGEVDIVARPGVERALSLLVAENVDVAVDCSALTFIDSMGVGALLEARNALDAQGHRMRMTNLRGAPRRVFEVLGLAEVLGIDGNGQGGQLGER